MHAALIRRILWLTVKGPEQMRYESEHCENMWDSCTGRCKADINHGTAQKERITRASWKQRPKTNAVLACTTGTSTLPLVEARTEGVVDVSPQHRTRGVFGLTRIYWTLEPVRGMGMPSN